jgi:replication fork clamp-binding protein CrfC
LSCHFSFFPDYLPKAVRSEISRCTEEMCGRNKAVAPQPITLRLYSPTVTNLTLVDLPGMTKVKIGSEQKGVSSSVGSRRWSLWWWN